MAIELVGSNKSSHEIGGGNRCTRTIVVPWASRLSTAEGLLGAPHPSIPACWVRSISIEPFPDEAKASGGDINPTSGEIAYALATLTLEYATDPGNQPWPTDVPKPSIAAGTALSLSIQAGAEFLRIPARAARWDDNPYGAPESPVPEDDSPAGRILIAKAEYALVWDYLADPPIARLNALVGGVNSGSFLGCPQETLLLMGYEMQSSSRASITAPWCWKINLKFSHRAVRVGQNTYGWNHEYRSDGWHRVTMDDGSGSQVERYPLRDFSDMFQ